MMSDPVSHPVQARRVHVRTRHVLVVRHVDVVPGAVVDARRGAHPPAVLLGCAADVEA